MLSFQELGLSNPILKAITQLGFEQPTEIQEQAIPLLIELDNDFIGLAQTGTGKTAAFGLPLIQRIDPHQPTTQALVLAPTRELCKQIASQLEQFSSQMPKLNVLSVYGGANISQQIYSLKRTQHIIIATPGRLIDLIKRKAVKLSKLQILVLDEADEMLNMGFQEEIDTILSFTPQEKLTWLFSATMPRVMKKIVNQYMHDPVEISVHQENSINKNIEHQYTMVRYPDKTEALMRFLDQNPSMRGVVFCRTRRDTQTLAEALLRRNYKADALHGELSQAQRDRVMKRFRERDVQVLIATDVAARGIDVNDLSHVFHFSLPDDISYYTHRSGRTARAGKTGTSIAFISGRDRGRIRHIENKLDISFEKVMIPNADDIASSRLEERCQSILQTKTKGRYQPGMLNTANMIFGDLSKEELIAKLVMHELDQMKLGSGKDLNEAATSVKKKSSGSFGRRQSSSRGGKPYFKTDKKGRSRKRNRKPKGKKR